MPAVPVETVETRPHTAFENQAVRHLPLAWAGLGLGG